MATQAQVDNFIKTIYPLAQKEALRRRMAGQKWVLPSVCIAQAALETGWGTSVMMKKANAYFGIKAGLLWRGKRYSTKTKECYDGINLVTITDAFRAYNSLQKSIEDYYKLICNSSRYKKACNVLDAQVAITAIKNAGYATAPDYIQSVMSVVKCHNLTKYDDVIKRNVIKRNVLGYYTASKKMRVRRGASTRSKAVGTLAKGKKFKVTQIQNKNWGYCSELKGWICLKYSKMV